MGHSTLALVPHISAPKSMPRSRTSGCLWHLCRKENLENFGDHTPVHSPLLFSPSQGGVPSLSRASASSLLTVCAQNPLLGCNGKH